MLRTILMTGLMVMLGLFALGFVFQIFGGLLALTFVLVGLAVKALIVGGAVYIALRIFAPDTARRLRQKWSDTSLPPY
jgi:hypothetical protein